MTEQPEEARLEKRECTARERRFGIHDTAAQTASRSAPPGLQVTSSRFSPVAKSVHPRNCSFPNGHTGTTDMPPKNLVIISAPPGQSLAFFSGSISPGRSEKLFLKHVEKFSPRLWPNLSPGLLRRRGREQRRFWRTPPWLVRHLKLTLEKAPALTPG